jgi:hypothetical protein
MRGTKQIVEIFNQPNLPGRELHPGKPDKCVQIRPRDRLDAKTGPPSRIEPAERRPDMRQFIRQRRRLELGLDLGALIGLARPLQQSFEDLPIWDAVFQRRKLEGPFGECPQLVAEG